MNEENVVLNEEVNPQKEVSDFKSPVKTFRSGRVSLTVWKNKNADGGEFLSFVLEKNYKDKNDQWRKTNSLGVADLPNAGFVILKAFNSMEENQLK